MVSKPQFAKMKKGVRIINCARGGIIDEAALLEALKSGKVAAAALDVFEKEPPVGNPLLEQPNVVVTPHLGASTAEAQVNVAITIAEQVLNAFRGAPVTTAINIPIMKPEVMEKVKPFLPLAEKLGRFAAQVAEGQIKEVTLGYYGEIAQKDVSLVTVATLKGLLDIKMGEPVNYVNASFIAKDRGIKVAETKFGETGDYTNLIQLTLKTDKQEYVVSGTIFGKDDARIVDIQGYRVDAVPNGHPDRHPAQGPAGRHRQGRHHPGQAEHQHLRHGRRPRRGPGRRPHDPDGGRRGPAGHAEADDQRSRALRREIRQAVKTLQGWA